MVRQMIRRGTVPREVISADVGLIARSDRERDLAPGAIVVQFICRRAPRVALADSTCWWCVDGHGTPSSGGNRT